MANGSGKGSGSGSGTGGKGGSSGGGSKGWGGRTSTHTGKPSGGNRSPSPVVPGHGKAP